jgi:hypothetical protein
VEQDSLSSFCWVCRAWFICGGIFGENHTKAATCLMAKHYKKSDHLQQLALFTVAEDLLSTTILVSFIVD